MWHASLGWHLRVWLLRWHLSLWLTRWHLSLWLARWHALLWLLLWPTPGAPGRPFDVEVEDDWVAAVTRTARRRLPILEAATIDRAACWAGLYEMSPDHHAILGASPRCPNLYFINGSSGHGVMHAPALGQLLAEIVSDGAASSLDVTALRPDRFTSGAPPAASPLL